jgi:hypothetical protein
MPGAIVTQPVRCKSFGPVLNGESRRNPLRRASRSRRAGEGAAFGPPFFLITCDGDLPRAVADFHAAFNIVIALAFLPVLSPVARLLQRILPNPVQAADPSRPLYLDPGAIGSPSIALGNAARETLRMADVLDSKIEDAANVFRRADRQDIARGAASMTCSMR